MKKKIINKVDKSKITLTKSLGALMKDEDGFVSKENILKVGLSTIGALGLLGSFAQISSGQAYSHTNMIQTSAQDSAITNNCAQHTNVTTHSSY